MPTYKSPGPDGFPGEFYTEDKKEQIPTLDLFQNQKAEGKLPKIFFGVTITLKTLGLHHLLLI